MATKKTPKKEKLLKSKPEASTVPLTINLFVACELAQVTRDGKVSLNGIFSRLTASSAPVNISRFFLVAMVQGQPMSQHQVSFRIIGPTQKDSIRQLNTKVNLGMDGKANIFNELTNTRLEEFGNYQIAIIIDNTKESRLQFDLVQVGAPHRDLRKRTTSLPN